MQVSNKLPPLIVIVLIAVATSAVIPLRTQSQRPSSGEGRPQINKSQSPVVDFTAPEPTDPDERAKRESKSKKFSRYNDYIGPGVTRAVEMYHWPPGFPAIPTDQSDAVIVGQITKASAHLTDEKSGVYSEFTVRIDEILKNAGEAPLTAGNPVVVDRPGGRVRFPTGKISEFALAGLGMPRVGGRYVLFIKRGSQAREWDIITGYELRNGRVYPLDKSTSSDTNFDIYANSDEASFLGKVRDSVGNTSRTTHP